MVTKTKQFNIRSLQNTTKTIAISINLPNGDFCFRNEGVPSSTKLTADGTAVDIFEDFVVELVIRPRNKKRSATALAAASPINENANKVARLDDWAQKTVQTYEQSVKEATTTTTAAVATVTEQGNLLDQRGNLGLDLDSSGQLVTLDELFDRGRYYPHHRDHVEVQLTSRRDNDDDNNNDTTDELEAQSPSNSNNDTPTTTKKNHKKRDRKPITITKSSFAQWLSKPWTNKNQLTKQVHSGPHRKYHGVQPYQTSNGTYILMCTLCKGGRGMVLPWKFGQHFATAKHWNHHLRLLEENRIVENNNALLLNNDDVGLDGDEDGDEMEEEGKTSLFKSIEEGEDEDEGQTEENI